MASKVLLYIAGGAIVLRTYLGLSPKLLLLLLVCVFVFQLLRGSSDSSEAFSPIYQTENASGLKWGVASVQGRRPHMEDMYQAAGFDHRTDAKAARLGLTHFFAVYDGHGGKRAAAWAHEHLVANLLETRMDPDDHGDVADALDEASVQAFLQTDREFLSHAALRGMPDGSTAVTCMLQPPAAPGGPRRLLVANLGDSRCCLVRGDGSAVALSDDHKPNRPDERARVQAAGGHVVFAGCWRVQGDLAVSRAFGDSHLKRYGVSAEPELSRYDLAEGDAQLVLASDGLWDVVDEAQCGHVLRRCPEPLDAARALCEMATQRGSMDNITVLVVALKPQG